VIVFVTCSGLSCGNGKNPKSTGAGVAYTFCENARATSTRPPPCWYTL
jgi:hypothetical protein